MNEGTCLLCFAVNRRTLDIINTHLQQVYEQLAGFKIHNASHSLCFICHTRLQQCHQLCQLVKQTQTVFESFQENSYKLINKLETQKPLVDLSRANVVNISILIDDEEIKQETDVKKEDHYVKDDKELDELENNEDFGKREESIKSSDSEDDVPLNDIRLKQELQTGEGTKTEVESKDCKDIKIEAQEIMLSEEEQMSEFLQRAKTVNYIYSPYKCDMCYRGFVDPAAYEKHKEKHDERMGSHECGICHLRYASARQLRAHNAAAHARRYVCTRCPHRAHTRNQAKEHEKWHRGHTYLCNLCGLKFSEDPPRCFRCLWPDAHRHLKYQRDCSKPTTYLTHQRKWHSSEHICGKCGESFASRHGLLLHLSKSHKRDPQTETSPEPAASRYCADCSKQFDNVTAWRRHVLTSNKHAAWSGDDEECKICGAAVSAQNRKSHMRGHARDLTPASADRGPPLQLACEQCGAYATSKSNLKAHVRRVHLGVKYNKNLVCEVCGKNCTSNATLRYHQRRHTGERPFACECGARFADSNQLRIHRRVHSGERPYPCSVCSKRFSQKPALNKHYRVHTGAKPYECQFCKRSFSQTNSLKLHVRAVHLKLPPNNRKKNQLEKIKKDTTETLASRIVFNPNTLATTPMESPNKLL